MTLKPGDTVHENYHILAKLSQGGFGVVYLAYDTSEARIVAIKEARENKDAERKLREEVGVLARAYHESLARIYDDFTSDEGRYCFVMEYILGDNLENLTTSGHLPTVQTAVGWIKQILEALTVLHSHQPPLVHRDVTLRNIQIHGVTGRAYLLDLGSATTGNNTTISVSDPYAPPEQYQPKRATTATDVYAVGICLYKLLTGVEPPMSLERKSGVVINPPRQYNPRVTSSLERVVLTAISLDPADRYPNALSMLEALEKAKVPPNEHRIAPVAPRRGNQRRMRPKQRNRWLLPKAELVRNRSLIRQLDISKTLLKKRRKQIIAVLRQLRDHRSTIDTYETPQPTREFSALLLRAWKNNLIQWIGLFLVIIGCGALLFLPGNFLIICLTILALGSYPLLSLGIISLFNLRTHGYHWKAADSWLRLSSCIIYSLFISLLIVAWPNSGEERYLLMIILPLTIIVLGIIVGVLISGVILYENN